MGEENRILSDLIVNSFQLKRASAVVNVIVDGQDLAVGRQRHFSGVPSRRLPFADLVLDQNAPAIGQPRGFALAFGVRRVRRSELNLLTVERVLFVDGDFTPRTFLLRVELHLFARMRDCHCLIESWAVAMTLVLVKLPGSTQIRLFAPGAVDRDGKHKGKASKQCFQSHLYLLATFGLAPMQ